MLYLLKNIIRKSQMSLFDWQPPKHEEERTIHATQRHLASGAIVDVKQHERKIEINTQQTDRNFMQTLVNIMSKDVFRDGVASSIQNDGQRVLDAAGTRDLIALRKLNIKYAQEAGRNQGGGGAGPGKPKQPRRGAEPVYNASLIAIQAITEKRVEQAKDSLKHTDENYRYKDIGHVPGSRKELAAAQALFIKERGKSGSGVGFKEINFDTLEENPREAFDLITKETIAKEIDWHGMKEQGVDPGAAFLINKLYTAVAPKPEDSPEARKDFVFGINALQERFEDCKTVDDVTKKISEISEEMTGFTMNPEQEKTWNELDAKYSAAAKEHYRLRREKDAVWEAYYKPSGRLSSLEYEQKKRINRGWKPDPELQQQIDSLKTEVDHLYSVQNQWRTDHDAELEAAEKASHAASSDRKAFKDSVIAANVISHPLTRGWNSFGKKFYGAINYRSHKGSDSFGSHVATAKSGKIADWDWLEKDTKPRATSQRSVQFQLRVADEIRREGGQPLPKADFSTADIQAEFNLANVQSGNWVLKDLNAAKHHTEQCALAFQDMSEMLGIPREEVSFNGRLSIAFGARGSGGTFGPGAAAHYEHKYRVINLTKMKGGGSLAHEWFHFADDVTAEVETEEMKGHHFYASEAKGNTETLKAFNNLMFTMTNGNHNEAIEAKLTITEAEKDHWLKFIDRQREMNWYGPTGRITKEIVDAPDLSAAVEIVFKAKRDGKFGAQKGHKAEKQYQLFKQMAVAHHAGTEGVYAVAGFKKGSSFYVESQKIDAGSGKKEDYWASQREMAARAFEAYISDKLHESGRENTYLAAYADNKYYIMDGVKPYPEGEERKQINAAFDKVFEAMKANKTLQKAQMDLFSGEEVLHTEQRQRKATTRRYDSGKVSTVGPMLIRMKVKNKPHTGDLFSYKPETVTVRGKESSPASIGDKIHYRTPEMNRKQKGTIVSGSHDTGFEIKPVRTGQQFAPPHLHNVHRDHIWTQKEHADENKKSEIFGAGHQIKPEEMRRRAEIGTARLGMTETQVIQHPRMVKITKDMLRYMALKNGIDQNYTETNGILYHPEDQDANDLYSEFTAKATQNLRTTTSKYSDEEIQKFHDFLDDKIKGKDSKIAASYFRTGKTAMIRLMKKKNKNQQESYDSTMEDDQESGMRAISAKGATQHASVTADTSKEAMEQAIDRLIGVEHPVDAAILKMKFGLGRYDHAQKPQDVAVALNRLKLPPPEGNDGWDQELVKQRATATLARMARDKGVQHLREFLKSLQEYYNGDDMLIKAHIKEYTREDGTVVQEHEDKRIKKHQDLVGHQNTHSEEIHSGAKLKHGDELAAHLKSRGWEERQVHSIRPIDGHKGGKKEEVPEPPEIPGKNRDNANLMRAEKQMKQMREAATGSGDPVAMLQHLDTTRTNTYHAFVDDYREKLLNHFGHKVDRDKTATKYKKDGHVITISKDGDQHIVEFAGMDVDHKSNKPIGKLAGKKEVETVDTGKKEAHFVLGKKNLSYTALDNEVKSNFALVEAHELTTSSTIDGHVNKAYPQEIQPRERSRVSSRMQMQKIAKKIIPGRLGQSGTATDGAPIVGKDGAVESGNGRTIALAQAYKNGEADHYKEWLKESAEEFGLKPEDVEKMHNPMLVRVRADDDTNTDRAQFAREANQSNNLGMSPSEQAWSDADRIDDDLVVKYQPNDGRGFTDEELTDPNGFIQGFLKKLGSNEAATLLDADGFPNSKATERAENAVFTKVYQSSLLTDLKTESARVGIKNIIIALNASIPGFVGIAKHDDLQVIPDIIEAIDYYHSNRNKPTSQILESLDQGNMFGGEDLPEFKTEYASQMVRAIVERTGSSNKIKNFLNAISDEIKNEVYNREKDDNLDMFSGPHQPKSKEQVVGQALNKLDKEETKKSFYPSAFTHTLRKSTGGTHGRDDRRGKVRTQGSDVKEGTGGSRRDGQGRRQESSLRKSQKEGGQQSEEGAGRQGSSRRSSSATYELARKAGVKALCLLRARQ